MVSALAAESPHLDGRVASSRRVNRHRQAGNAGHAPCRSSFRSLVDRALSRRRRRALPGAVQHHAHPLREPDRSGKRPFAEQDQQPVEHRRRNTRWRIGVGGKPPGALSDRRRRLGTHHHLFWRRLSPWLGPAAWCHGAEGRSDRNPSYRRRGDRHGRLFGRSLCSLSAVAKSRPWRPCGLRRNLRWHYASERGDGLHHQPSADRGAAERQLGLGRMAADARGRRHPFG